MKEETQVPAADAGRGLSEGLGLFALLPACWTLTETLEANETTTAGYLWFTNPQNTAWEPLYRRAALLRVLDNAKAVYQHNAELLAECERLRAELRARGPRWADGGDAMAALEELQELRDTAAFYKRRCDALQAWQSSMRDPERTVVCDILANGFTLDQPFAGDRYGGLEA